MSKSKPNFILHLINRLHLSLRIGLFSALSLCFLGALIFYLRFFTSITNFSAEKIYILIPSNAPNRSLVLREQLEKEQLLSNKSAFYWLADYLHLWNRIRPGRYCIRKGMSAYEIIKMLKVSAQAPVTVTLKKYRTKEQLAGFLATLLEPDSASFLRAFSDAELLKRYQVNEDLFFTLIIINTYQFLWNTSPEQFIDRSLAESLRFWTPARLELANKLKLLPREVYILASIVDEESNKDDEKPIIASVYLNRLHKQMRLEADPTVKFCTRNFALRRILFKHLSQDCPYNTYLHSGLPPGPICTPSIASIDAVLNYSPSNYLFFCARPERDGYHNFATNLAEHMRNARAFHKKLNQDKVL